jgi:anaerobic ribonucleoside-triphosphate reductase activating protein
MSASVLTMQIAHIVPCTEAEGPGRRFAVWFQGCPLRCAGCCNPEMLPFDGGTAMTIDDLLRQLGRAVERHGVEGVTLLGGEPFAHAAAACGFARRVRELGLSVMIFSGYELEELRAMSEPAVDELLACTDLLVDGRYLRDQPDATRRWIGSRNQRIHFLTERYRPDDPCWRQRDTLEIRLRGGEVTVNGFPARKAVGLWKRLDAWAKR